jgi:hypothetical protein
LTEVLSIESIGRSQNPYGEAPVTTNQSLAIGCADTPFITVAFPTTQKAKEGEYIDSLTQVLEEISEMLDYRLPLLDEVAQSLREHLHYEDFEKFEEKWADWQDSLWELIDMGHYRNIPIYTDLSSRYSRFRTSRKQLYEVKTHPKTEDFWVYVHGSRPIGFMWSHRERSQKEARTFAKRSANAFAFRIVEDLKALVKFLGETERIYSAPLTQLKEQVQGELSLYRRLIIKGQATNAGRTPYSLMNKSRMFVYTRGLPYKENGRPTEYEDDMQIDMVLVDDHKLTTAPLSVGSGEVSRFTAVSEDYVTQLNHSQLLLDTYRGGNTKFYMGMLTTLSNKQWSSSHYTKDRYFKDWDPVLSIPPK